MGNKASARLAFEACHFHAAADRRVDHLRIVHEIVGNRFLAGKLVRPQTLEFHVGKAVVPDRPVLDQGVPALTAPALCNAAALQHEVRFTCGGEVFTGGNTCLSRTDYQR